MKRLIVSISFVLLIFNSPVSGQNSILSVTGHVFDMFSGNPIENQIVALNITGNGMNNTYEFISNNQGYWGSDSLVGYTQGTVHASTYDCNGQIHEFIESYFPDLNSFVFDFHICQDTMPGNDCDNWFQYLTNDNWTFQFTGEVFPDEQAMFTWDFGDGSFGNGQQVTHVYEPSGVAFYTTCLTTYSTGISGDSCIAVTCQDIYVGDPGGDCINWFLVEQINALTFQFHGESAPSPAQIYSWNFGDGQTGLGQDVSHSFDPGTGNQFLVQLTTFSFDPATGDSCMAFSEQWVYINTIPDCQADFYYSQDTLQPLEVDFTDNSTGAVTSRYWDFGDGISSTEINPIHLFPGPGTFYVCLTITTDSLGLFCTDTYCEEITLFGQLNADFIYVLDTLSGLSRNYYFIDNSTGDPDSWSWVFGDGTNSTQQNPIHQFVESELYNVCLQITKTYPNGGSFTDIHCQEIIVPSYYDIGGLAFIGNTPINNPISTGDTGIAYLYRKYNDVVIPVDTNYFYEYGYYWFSDVREGNHLVKVGLTENSEHVGSFAPSYYQQQLYWNQANIIQVQDSNNYVANVYLPELSGAATGMGAISGNIVDMPNPSMSDYVFDQPVFLYNASEELLTYVMSNVMGSFTFENLAFGTYKLSTDVTGFYGTPVSITIDQANPVYYNALLEIYEGNPNEIPEFNFNTFNTGPVYPNPLKDILNIDLNADKDFILKADIYSLTGQKVLEHEFMIQNGNNTLTVPTDGLENGLYFIILHSDAYQVRQSYKFLKK